jgi:hypothetical protein
VGGRSKSKSKKSGPKYGVKVSGVFSTLGTELGAEKESDTYFGGGCSFGLAASFPLVGPLTFEAEPSYNSRALYLDGDKISESSADFTALMRLAAFKYYAEGGMRFAIPFRTYKAFDDMNDGAEMKIDKEIRRWADFSFMLGAGRTFKTFATFHLGYRIAIPLSDFGKKAYDYKLDPPRLEKLNQLWQHEIGVGIMF